jgi:DhnA family fructose-bisphosphate aldolase class Ia
MSSAKLYNERIYTMHSLPAIVIMNMTDEQREEYNRQEAARLARQADRDLIDQEMHVNLCTFWLTVAVCALAVVVAIVVV